MWRPFGNDAALDRVLLVALRKGAKSFSCWRGNTIDAAPTCARGKQSQQQVPGTFSGGKWLLSKAAPQQKDSAIKQGFGLSKPSRFCCSSDTHLGPYFPWSVPETGREQPVHPLLLSKPCIKSEHCYPELGYQLFRLRRQNFRWTQTAGLVAGCFFLCLNFFHLKYKKFDLHLGICLKNLSQVEIANTVWPSE